MTNDEMKDINEWTCEKPLIKRIFFEQNEKQSHAFLLLSKTWLFIFSQCQWGI
jgi:hypothetical protein